MFLAQNIARLLTPSERVAKESSAKLTFVGAPIPDSATGVKSQQVLQRKTRAADTWPKEVLHENYRLLFEVEK